MCRSELVLGWALLALVCAAGSASAVTVTYSIDIGWGTPRSGQADGAFAQTGSWNKVSLTPGGGTNTITVNNLTDGAGAPTPGVSFLFNDNNATYAYYNSVDGAVMSPDLGQNLTTTGDMNWKFTGLAPNTAYTIWTVGWANDPTWGAIFEGPAPYHAAPTTTRHAIGGPTFQMTTDGSGTLSGCWGDNKTFNYERLDALQIQGEVSPSWPDYLPGDFNKDGEVGPEDFGILKDGFGLDNLPFGNHESWTLGDANDDGEIGPEDFGLLKDNFGLDGGPTGTYPLTNVPEPASLVLLGLAGLAIRRKQR
ncbi:MAG: PEP-CTERM sorting domain-containing protein [Planctomycetota bacterium]|nr:PEP-CTERM sorting domain-containing protein [Planctomycetota bacterium]